MEFFKQFAYLFANMEWFVVVVLVLGFMLLLIEIFQPGFGVFGISGIILFVAAVILRAVYNSPDDHVLIQVFWLVFLESLFLAASFGFLFLAHKKGWLKKTPFALESTAVSMDFSEGTEDFSQLVGQVGLTITDLRPSGKIQIEDKIYDVTAENFFIEKRREIRVTAVEGVKITVKEKLD